MKLVQFLQTSIEEHYLLICYCLLLMGIVLLSVLSPSLSGVPYVFTSGLLIFAGLSVWGQLKQKKYVLALYILGIAFFFAQKQAILSTEFWGDEIGVIQIAQQKFSTIAQQALISHIAVPPLDYQNLHWWLVLTQNVPASQQEFFWRAPYMLMHIATAILFTLVVLTNLNLSHSENKNFMLLIFLVYLTNPLFFVYGIEIRFYTLSLLGLMLVYYGFATHQTASFWWLSIAILLSLNSTVFPIYITLFASTVLVLQKEKTKNLVLWLTLLATQLVILGTFSKTLTIPDASMLFSWKIFQRSLEQFLGSSTSLLLVVPIVVSAWIQNSKQLLKEIPSHTFIMLASSLGFITVIFYCFLLRPHFDIGVRHFILGIPVLLIFFYQTIIASHRKLAMGIFAMVLLVQLVLLNQGLKNHLLEGKDFLNVKNAFEIAAAQDFSVVFLKSTDMDNDLKIFYELTLKWYARRYQTPYKFLILDAESCQETLIDHSESVFIKGELLEIPCIPKEPIQLLEYHYQ